MYVLCMRGRQSEMQKGKTKCEMRCDVMWCDECANAKHVALNFTVNKNKTQVAGNKTRTKAKRNNSREMRSAKCGMPKGKGRGRAGQGRAGQGLNWGIKQRRKANLWLLSRKYVAFVAILPPSARFKLCESAENMQSNRNFMLRLAALSLSPALPLSLSLCTGYAFSFSLCFAFRLEMQMTWQAVVINTDESN